MKTKYFNKYVHPFLYLSVAIILLLFSGCSKDEDPVPEQEPVAGELMETDGISANELGVSSGSIGLIIDTRAVARKGYLPAKAAITVEATEGDYSDTIDIDLFTNMGELSMELDSLSTAAAAELKAGVPLGVVIMDEMDNPLVSESFSAESFRKNGTRIEISAKDVSTLDKSIAINPEIPYFIQFIDINNIMNSDPFEKRTNMSLGLGVEVFFTDQVFTFANLVENGFHLEDDKASSYYLRPVPGKESTFYLKNAKTGDFVHLTGQDWLLEEPLTDLNNIPPEYEFILEVSESGNVKIKTYKHGINDFVYLAIRNNPYHPDFRFIVPSDFISLGLNAHIGEFRIVPARSINWQIESLVTKHMEPILPPADNSFGVNSTLTNCSQGNLEQQFTYNETEETSATMAWEESVELVSETTTGFSASVEVSTSAKFFGAGVDVSASASTNYSSTTGYTSTSSQYSETEDVKSKTFEVSRTIEVLPGTAVLVYDAYQSYTNVEIPYVQSLRVRGTDNISSMALTGKELKTQFAFNYFNGVITKIESDYIEVTVRGTTNFKKLIRTKSEVKEVENNCDDQ